MMLNVARVSIAGPMMMCVCGCLPLTMAAQDNGVNGPPKVLVIQREFTKPGKGGSLHEKTESAYIAAVKAGKGPIHYLAITAMTGADRALFLSGYASMAAWEAESKAMDKNATMSSALDRAMIPDGDLLASTDSSVWLRRDDLSLNNGGLTGARYMEIEQFMVKPGHMKEWDELVKMYVEGFKKVPGGHWTTFQQVYGTNSNSFIVLTPLKSLSEADDETVQGKAFEAGMGESNMKKLAALEAACVESEMTNLFHFSPKMSIPADEWVKAEPDYWKPKVVAPAVKKPAEAKPAAQ